MLLSTWNTYCRSTYILWVKISLFFFGIEINLLEKLSPKARIKNLVLVNSYKKATLNVSETEYTFMLIIYTWFANHTCGKNNIAQTGTILADRILVNKQKMKDPTTWNTACSGHFDSCVHSKFYSFLFYKVKEEIKLTI